MRELRFGFSFFLVRCCEGEKVEKILKSDAVKLKCFSLGSQVLLLKMRWCAATLNNSVATYDLSFLHTVEYLGFL